MHPKLNKFRKLIQSVAFSIDRPLDEERIEFYLERLKNYDLNLIEKALNNLILRTKEKKFPAVAEIIDEIRVIKEELSKPWKPVFCKKCNSTGFIIVAIQREKHSHDIAYRCDCENGKRLCDKMMTYEEAKVKHELMDDILPDIQRINIQDIDPLETYENIKVIKKCINCRKSYTVCYNRRVSGGEILLQDQKSPKKYCDSCLKEKGREVGLWQ